jgi:hypothetical protein
MKYEVHLKDSRWEDYGDVETFNTRREAEDWIRRRTYLLRDNDVTAEIVAVKEKKK